MPIEFSSSEAEAYYQQALAHEDEDEKEYARENYRMAAAIDPLHPEVWCRLGLVSPAGEDYAAFDNALRCRALTAEELYWRGRAALAYHHDVDALRDWAASVALDPRVAYRGIEHHTSDFDFYEGRWYPGWEQDQPGPHTPKLRFWELQMQCYNQLVALYPTQPEYRCGRAAFYESHDHLPQALADYNAAIKLGAHAYYRRKRGPIRLMLRDFKGALQDFTHDKSSSSNWRVHGPSIHYCDPDQPYGSWMQALESFEGAGLKEPTHPLYLKHRFEHYTRWGQHARALAAVEALVAAEPNRADLRDLRIECRLALPGWDVADLLSDYEWLALAPRPKTKEELRVHGRDPDYYDPLHEQCRQLHCCAWAHYRLGNYAASLQSFAAAVAVPSGKKTTDDSWGSARGCFCGRLLVHDVPYLLWQLQQQLPGNRVTARSHWIVTWWMACAIAKVPYQLVPNLGEAFEAYLYLSLPPQDYYATPPAPARYEQALALSTAGAEQAAPEYAGFYAALRSNIHKSQLRQALNEPTATPTSKEAALARYDAACALEGPCPQG